MADPGEGPGRPGPTLFFDQTEAQRAKKKFVWRPPPLSPLPSPLPPYLKGCTTGNLTVADPGEGPGGHGPTLFFDQTEAQSAKKKFFWRPPPPLPPSPPTSPPPSPLISKSGSGTALATTMTTAVKTSLIK